MTEYKIQIFTKHFQTEFNIQSPNQVEDVKELHKAIIDFLGKNDIEWQQNKLRYNGRSKFYITYEEVKHGSRGHDVAFCQEDSFRI